MSSPQDSASPRATKAQGVGTNFKACPNCGASDIHSLDCPHCGIVFAKWMAREVARQQGVERPTQQVEPEIHHEAPRTGLDVQISPATRIMRVAVGLLACLLAFFIYSNGKAFLDFQLFVVLLTYACVGVWVFATTLAPVSTRQFMVEVLFIAVATVPAYALNPEIFGIERGTEMHALSHAPKPRENVKPLVENTLNNLMIDLEESRVFSREERNNWILSVHEMPLATKLKELAQNDDANDGDLNKIDGLSDALERALVRSWVYRNGDWKLDLSLEDRRSIVRAFNSLADQFMVQLKMDEPAETPSANEVVPATNGGDPTSP